jgi:hypothetical protein
MQLRSQRPLHVQGDAGHPSYQGGGPKRIIGKKWRADEEERHKGSLTPKSIQRRVKNPKSHAYVVIYARAQVVRVSVLKFRGGPGLIFWAWVGLGLHTSGSGFLVLEKFTK